MTSEAVLEAIIDNPVTATEQVDSGLSVMWQISEALSQAIDLHKTLQIILTGVTANQGLGFNRAFLFLADENVRSVSGKMALGPRNPEEAGQIWSQLQEQNKSLNDILNEYLDRETSGNFTLSSLINGWSIPTDEVNAFSRALNRGEGINLSYEDTLDRTTIEILERLQTGNLAISPIICKGKPLGLIAADHQITGKAISDNDVRLLQTFANHIAVALDRSRLYDNLKEYAESLEEKNRLLAESQEQLIQIEKMSVIGELTSSIAHELRNPLTVIGGFANLILSSGKGNEYNEYLNIIVSEAKRAEAVLNQVLDFSRDSKEESQSVDFNQLVKSTYELFLSKIPRSLKRPELMMCEHNEDICCNPSQLQHAIYQIMYIPVEEMTGECRLRISTEIDKNSARIYIDFESTCKDRDQMKQAMKNLFGSSTGNHKLSVIVAGETIKYHGGDFGLELKEDSNPRLYIELPLKRSI